MRVPTAGPLFVGTHRQHAVKGVETTTEPEPWLRGPLAGIPAHIMPVYFSFGQVRDNLAEHTAGITDEQVWRAVAGNIRWAII